MSSLLEEAIVDAKALKSAALKNAENTVLEKYSSEVKDAISTLLEQDEFGLEEDAEGGAPDLSFTDEVPFAFQTEELDAPAENELIEIDFDQLKARIAEEEAAGVETPLDATMDAEATALELQEDGPITDVELEDDSQEDTASIATGKYVGQTVGAAETSPRRDDDLDEDIALSEEMLSDLVEELVVDMIPRPQGWSAEGSAYNSVEQANDQAMAAAQEAHLEEEEELEDVRTAPDVVSDAELFESKISQLTISNKELHALLVESKNQLKKLNLENAKLVYQNKALNSASLNERQKNQIVEAVQSANSVEEARMIFETIQNAVGASSGHRTRPQTLREAVTRPTSLLINSKKNNTATKDPKMDRMLRLAGLTKH